MSRQTLGRLRAVRNVYGEAAEREKRALLRALAPARLVAFRDVDALCADLLFLCAFPGATATRRLAQRLLRDIGARVHALPRAERAKSADTGIAGSTTCHVFPYPIARWLARIAPGQVEVAWRDYAAPAGLDAYIALLLSDAEREGFDSGAFSTRGWVRDARRTNARTDLEWLLEDESPARAARLGLEAAWDAAEVPLAWNLGDSRFATHRNARRSTGVVLRTDLRRPPRDLAAVATAVVEPLPAIERLARRDARDVIAVARAALAARCREVNAMTTPNVDEVWWCDLGAGTALAVLGIDPARRLNLETNTGYVLFANGIPVGYGGVTPLFRQANTGINVFDPFRGSEAAFLWTQMLRAFRTLYGSTRFVVNAYQFGAGNAEARQSGAFWFYHRLGFRPVAPAARTVASREAQRMAADRGYRPGTAAMRVLLAGDLVLDLPDFAPADYVDEALLPHVGALAARSLARQPDRTRAGAQRRVDAAVAEALGVHDLARWPAPARHGFARLAPVVAALPGLAAWRAAERAALAALLRAKGAPQERTFAQASLAVPRFFHELVATLRAPVRPTARDPHRPSP